MGHDGPRDGTCGKASPGGAKAVSKEMGWGCGPRKAAAASASPRRRASLRPSGVEGSEAVEEEPLRVEVGGGGGGQEFYKKFFLQLSFEGGQVSLLNRLGANELDLRGKGGLSILEAAHHPGHVLHDLFHVSKKRDLGVLSKQVVQENIRYLASTKRRN